MRLIKVSLLLTVLFYIKLSAQFSLETFLSDSLNHTLTSIKGKLIDKKITENNDGTFDVITYYDWLDPISIKIVFLFKKNGNQTSMSLANTNESEEESQNLFNLAIEGLIKKYGASISNKSIMGITMYSCRGAGGSVITLAHESKKTRLMMMVFK